MYQTFFNILFYGLILISLFSCKQKVDSNSWIDHREETVIDLEEAIKDISNIPQIVQIIKSPDRLTKEIKTYTVTIITHAKNVTLDNTEFSINGTEWQKSAEFKNVECGKKTFYTRNKKDKSMKDQKEMCFECFVDVPLPTIIQLNELLQQTADCNDRASDELRQLGKNLPVRGITHVDNIEQLVRDACMNGIIYVVQRIESDSNGNLTEIFISKKS